MYTQLSRKVLHKPERPVRIIQYGEGNFLRAFADYFFQVIISNTTEAGIIYYDSDTLSMQPPESFPAKLTQFLYKRYTHFNGDLEKGLIILSCELIDSNGDRLKEIVFQLADDIPQGHKFSLCRLNPGDDIIKYKEDSGGFMLSS